MIYSDVYYYRGEVIFNLDLQLPISPTLPSIQLRKMYGIIDISVSHQIYFLSSAYRLYQFGMFNMTYVILYF